ncbi:copper binding proteins, plastocyanin/azurin family protein [Mycobacterium bohemicum DSM 44277]|uniref:Copper binding proteins, plastocyanin/azurin family protein n=1 Tax=Mycobacterium bohemicum DSM 44277 TaxID=1236609 RepID=A0A0U0WEA2_MYCBE|nr:cupredoxin family copper-binding protein [Mycobacterium bohemicum]CPR13411.1 copper binding proteins, plastocyanin/azurin family protein [Mycobacterium bohemicum DSM 44277]
MTTKLRKRLLAASAASALLLAGCSSSPPAAQPSVGPAPATGSPAAATGDQVSIDNFAFAPATLTVKAGATVTWTNRDEEPHTVAASDGSFHSPGMGTGATYSHTFPTAGKFDYVCSIHPMMHGTVVVTG